MTNSIISTPGDRQDRQIWSSLRQAIAKSSGFKRWRQERNEDLNGNLEMQVRRYLEETLETLAY